MNFSFLSMEKNRRAGESGRLFLAFHFSAAASELLECGNRNAISKDGGKDGKPDVGFSRLSMGRHFNSSSSDTVIAGMS
jgi:hypothetical protein